MKSQNIFLKIAGVLVSCFVLSYSSSFSPIKYSNVPPNTTQSESIAAASTINDNEDHKTVQDVALIQSPKQAVDFRMNVYYSSLDKELLMSLQNNNSDSTEKKKHNKTNPILLANEVQDSACLTSQLEPQKVSDNAANPIDIGNKIIKDSGSSINLVDQTESEPFQFRIYPNPADVFCKIELTSNWIENELDYRIYDILGKYIEGGKIQSDITEINTSNYPNGIFIITIQSKKLKINSSERLFIKR